MEFPAEAVYGPNHTPSALSNWDGRDEYEDVVQVASRDDDGHADAGAVEVMRTMSLTLISPRCESLRNTGSLPSWGTSSQEESESEMELESEEPVSPHIDTTLMMDDAKEHHQHQHQQQQAVLSTSSAGNSPSSANSLMMDLSDLEHSLNDEVTTVKDWLRKVKSERDKLRRDKTSLTQKLAAERQGRNADVSQLNMELSGLKEMCEGTIEDLTEELQSVRLQMAEETLAKDVATKSEAEVLQTQVDSVKLKMSSLEEALIKEKSSSTLREANKLELIRKEHFAQLSNAIIELEIKFAQDLEEMTLQKESSLEEERMAHRKTAQTLVEMRDEKEEIANELEDRNQELEELRVEHEQCATLIEEGYGAATQELSVVKIELDALHLEHADLKQELDTTKVEMDDLSLQLEVKSTKVSSLQSQIDQVQSNHLQEHDRMKDQLKNMCELVEVTSSDRDTARDDLKESQIRVQELTKAHEEAQCELKQLKEEAQKRTVEIGTLNEARKCFEQYEADSKGEIIRLRMRLEETSADILRSVQSSDSGNSSGSSNKSSDDSSGGGVPSVGSKDSSHSSTYGGATRKARDDKMMLAVPALDETSIADMTTTEISVMEEMKMVPHTELLALRERLAGVEKERDGLHAEIDRSKRERDALRRMVDALKPLSGGGNGVVVQTSTSGSDKDVDLEKEVNELKEKLAKAEDAYVKAEVSKLEKLGAITQERNVLVSQVKTLKASLLIRNIGDKNESASVAASTEDRCVASAASAAKAKEEIIKANEELTVLQDKLDTQVKVNERLSCELTMARETVTANNNATPSSSPADLQERFDTQVEEIEKLTSELTSLRSSADNTDGSLHERIESQMKHNERLSSELQALKSSSDSASDEVEEKMVKISEEVGKLQDTLHDTMMENDQLRSAAETASASVINVDEQIRLLQDELDIQVQRNEELSFEFNILRAATTTGGDADSAAAARIQIGKEIDGLQVEHHIEIKLLKQEHADVKTQISILSKEKEQLTDAYEMERQSNNELEVSLEEMVNLLEAERMIHRDRAKEFRVIKKKYGSLRKRRVPVDCAYLACRLLLDRVEERRMNSDSSAPRRGHAKQEVNNTIKLIDGLTQVLEERAGSESSLLSISETFSSENNEQMEELAGKCENLEVKVRAMKLKIASYSEENMELKQRMDQLSEADDESMTVKSSQTSLPDRHETLRNANKSLKEKSKHLTKELVDSTKAFEETITSYEAVIAKVKNALSDKKQENEVLKKDLDEAQCVLTELEGKVEEERQDNEALKNELDGTQNALIDVEGKMEALKNELDGSQSVVTDLDAKMEEEKQENETLKNKLDGAQSALTNLEAKLEEGMSDDEKTIAALEKIHNETLESHENELNAYREVVEVLKKKLEEGGAIVKNLEADKTKLRLEVGRLKTDFSEVISQFEEELTRSCEASEAALQKEHDDCEAAKAALKAKEDEYSQVAMKLVETEEELDGLRSELADCEDNDRESAEIVLEHETTIRELRGVLDEKESERKELQKSLDQMNASRTEEDVERETEVRKLQNKLEGAMASIREYMEVYEQHETTTRQLRHDLKEKELERQDLETALGRQLEGAQTHQTHHEATIRQLRDDLEVNESAKQELETILARRAEEAQMHQTEVEQLRSQLDGAMLSLDENMQFYEKLRADCTDLKEEKESALEKVDDLNAKITSLALARDQLNAELEAALEKNIDRSAQIESLTQARGQLHADFTNLKEKQKASLETNDELIAKNYSLTEENALLQTMMEQQTQSVDFVESQLGSIRDEVRSETLLRQKTEEERQKAAQAAEEAREELQRTTSTAEEDRQKAALAAEVAREELRRTVSKAEEERQKAALAAEEARQELRRTTSKLDDMFVCNERLEDQIGRLHEDARKADEAHKKASQTADATQEELLKATMRLDDMLGYTQKLKAEHEQTRTSLKNEMDEQMKSMNEVVQSLQSQVKTIESEKEENRRMYEKDISLQQAEVERLKIKHGDSLNQLDSLSELVKNLKAALGGEKENAQILLSQFKKSENDRKYYVKQKEELEAELASRLKSESIMTERIRNLEGLETELAVRIKSENTMSERIRNLEAELQELRPRTQAKEEELNGLRALVMENENIHNGELSELKSKIDEDKRKYTTMQERISSMESHTKNLDKEFKRTLQKKEEEASKLRVVLQEAKEKLGRLWEDNEDLKNGNNESMHSLQQMLNDAIRSRANTDASLQESLQLLEQQKRIDIKRKGEVAKLEQTVEILKSKERYLESYVASLKKQMRRG